ncbi:hypothetical protein BDU57DRAFT_507933 [Ampelomyces quisqualis]|uniref:Uncharacterized protein n=1 Tax=Ampelomyces quisqualis TaxID=50730 RepID=A0A6A5Q9A8_AMPQU|nr:hypothetical protein BDU57DRAFT_507933 [Ampelomyces quisqualis]
MAKRRTLSPARHTRRMTTAHAAATVTDNAEETPSTESQQVLALGSLLKEPKTDNQEVQHFRREIVADRKRMEALLDQRAQQAQEAETRRRSELASTIREALTTPNRNIEGEAPTFYGTIIAEHLSYVPVANVLASSSALLQEYERLDKVSTDMRDEQAGPVTETWHQELQEAERQLQMGARVALRNVQKVLGVNVESIERIDTGGEGDGQDELNYELHKSLRYAERGVRRMVKGLPDDED